MVAVSASAAKGVELEQLVAAFLRTVGYEARTNVVLEGRSGARHEIDVLAEKVDALSTFRVAVECKAWDHPIEKDVIAKLVYVLGDLGIHKGIVATMSGYRSGAEKAAVELGIELWGSDELAQRLGRVVLTDLATGAPRRAAPGLPYQVSLDRARAALFAQARGRFGVAREQVIWRAPVWLPVAVVQIALSRVEGRVKKVTQTRRQWNAYELLDGRFVASWSGEPVATEIDLGRSAIRPRLKPTTINRTINDAYAKLQSVTTEAAQARHRQRVADLGIPMPNAVTIESVTNLFLPMYAGILRGSGGGERVAAINGLTGQLSDPVSTTLTLNVHWLRESLS